MHPLAHLRLILALGVWMVLLFLFLLRGNLWLRREGSARKVRVLASLLFTACLAVGFLLMPGFPVLGGGVLIAACSLVLLASVHRATHQRGSPRSTRSRYPQIAQNVLTPVVNAAPWGHLQSTDCHAG